MADHAKKDTELAEDGGPAFPTVDYEFDPARPVTHYGLSVRDYFAIEVFKALVAAKSADGAGPCEDNEWIESAYRSADMMLRVRGPRYKVWPTGGIDWQEEEYAGYLAAKKEKEGREDEA